MISRRLLTRSLAVLGSGPWASTIGFAQALPAPSMPRHASVLQVGPTRSIKTIAKSSILAKAGDTIEVDSGTYTSDTAVWERDNLTVRSGGGRVRLVAHGSAAEGKGIWVVRANGMRVEGFDFEGAAVPSRNGAGIRLETGSLLVRDCRFMHNEMGLLTNNDPNTVLEVENSEFGHNQRPDGHNHNLYVGQIARLSVTGSYFHHARSGHLLKSRAALNRIFYNRLTDEDGGSASYELEFPNGGVCHVVGNLIEQGPQSENSCLISVGAEGHKWPLNEIHLIHNTLVNLMPQGGQFLRTQPGLGQIRALNNLLVGQGELETAGPGDYRNNFAALASEFANLETRDARLRSGSRLLGRAIEVGGSASENLTPKREYFHPRNSRPVRASKHNPGAMQSMA